MLRPDGSKFAPEAEKVATAGLGDVAKKGAQILGGIFAGGALVAAAKQGFDELKDAQEAAALTQQAVTAQIEALGSAATITTGHVEALSESLLEQSGVDDEVAQKGAQVLLNYQSIQNQLGEGNQIFDRALTAANDLSVRGFGDLSSTSKLLGLALEDPEIGFTKLRRAGILFTEDQKATIRGLEETGDHLGAQQLILEAVEGKVGGAGKAYGETLPGQLKIAQESLKNAEATVVAGAAPAFELLADVVTAAAGAVEELPGPLRDVAAIGGAIGAGLLFIQGPLSSLLNTMALVRNTRAVTSTAVVAADTAEATSQGAVLAANAATTASYEPLITAKVGATVAAQAEATAEAEVAAWRAFVAGETTAAATATNAATASVAAGGIGAAGALGIMGAALVAVGGPLVAATVWANGFSDGVASLKRDVEGLGDQFLQVGEGVSAQDSLIDFLETLVAKDAELRGGLNINDALASAGVNVEQFAGFLAMGDAAFIPWIQRLELSGAIASDTRGALEGLRDQMESQAQATLHSLVSMGLLTEEQLQAAFASHRAADGSIDFIAALNSVQPTAQAAKDSMFSLNDAVAGDAEAFEEATKRLNEYQDGLRAAIDPMFGMVDASQDLKDAQAEAAQAQEAVTFWTIALNNAIRDGGPNSEAAKTAYAELAQAERDKRDADEAAVKSAQDLDAAAFALVEQVRLHPESWGKATEQIKKWQEQGLITTEQAQHMNEEMFRALGLAEEVDGTQANMILGVDTTPIDIAIARVNELNFLIKYYEEHPGEVNAAQAAYGGGLAAAAGGGEFVAGQRFIAGEAGVELALLGPGRYTAPAGGASIVTHTQTMQFLANIQRAIEVQSSAQYQQSMPMTSPIDQSIRLNIGSLVTPNPQMSAVVLGRSLRGLRYRVGRGTGRTS